MRSSCPRTSPSTTHACPVRADPISRRQLGASSSKGTWTGPAPCRCGSTARSRISANSPLPGGWRERSTSDPRPRRTPRSVVSRTVESSLAVSCRGNLRRCSATRSGGLPARRPTSTRMVPRYWYSTQPTVTKLAEDRAEQLRRDPDKVVQELGSRLRADLRNTGEFSREFIHVPQSGQDVPDDRDARLVVLGTDTPLQQGTGQSRPRPPRKTILESRGSVPRLYRNALVFLAVDRTRLQDLDEAVRRYLAWDSILVRARAARPLAAPGQDRPRSRRRPPPAR